MINPGRKMLVYAAVALGATAAVAVPAAAFADAGSTSPGAPPTTTAVTTATNLTPASTTPGKATRQADTLAAIKARAAAAITVRTGDLQSAISSVQANKYLTTSDQSTILATLNSDLSGLNALGPVIQADTTVAQARSDYDTIFTKYRVLALALPQSRLAAAADDLTGTVVPRLTDAQQKLQGLLSGQDSDKDSAAVQAAMADLGHRIAGIASDTNGLSAAVLSYTPAEWSASRQLVSTWRSKLQDARSDAKAARTDVRTVVQAIRS